jgi:hypothetical protein
VLVAVGKEGERKEKRDLQAWVPVVVEKEICEEEDEMKRNLLVWGRVVEDEEKRNLRVDWIHEEEGGEKRESQVYLVDI